MDWKRWTKAKLRLYVSQELYRQDIHNELSAMDDNIQVRISRLDGLPRSGGLPSSPVEREVEHREEAQERLLGQLRKINAECEQIDAALKGLSDIERRALEWAYMQANYNSDAEVAKRVKLPLKEFWRVKTCALHRVYRNLNGIPHTIDLTECVEYEEQRHKWALKLQEERKEQREQQKNEPLSFFFDDVEPHKVDLSHIKPWKYEPPNAGF